MALQLRKGHTSSLGKAIATSFAVIALVLQPLVAGNIPAAFADDGINTQAELVAAIDDTSLSTITLSGGFEVSSQININHTLVLDGNNNTLTAASGWTGSGGNDSVLAVVAGNPTVRNVVVDGAAASEVQGVQVWQSAATLENVTSKNNQKAGIHVNGSTVNAINITTSNNSRGKSFLGVASFGGIVVSSGTLNISGLSTHNSENNQIRRNGGTVNDSSSQYYTTSILVAIRYTLKAAPVAPSITAPSAGTTVQGGTTVSWNAPSTNSTTQAAATYKVSLDGTLVAATSSTSYTFASLASGSHTVTVQSVSASGLVGGTASRSFTVNNLPQATVTTPTAAQVVSTKRNGNKLHVEGTFTDDNAVNYLQLELVKDGNLVTVYTMHYSDLGLNSDGTFAIDIPVSATITEGAYSLFYTPTDFTGGVGPRTERVFKIDNTNPTITVKTSTGNNDGSYLGQGGSYSRISFKLFDGAGNLKEVELNDHVYSRSGTWNDLNWQNITKSHLNQGDNTIIVRDKAGNESSLNFHYDNVAPVVGLVAPAGATNANTVEVKGWVTDDSMRYYACYITTNQNITAFGENWTTGQEPKNAGNSLTDTSCNTKWTTVSVGDSSNPVTLGNFDVSGLPEGDYTIHVHAHDRADNQSESTIGFTIDRTAPVVALGTITAITVGDNAVVSGTVNDPSVGEVEIFVGGVSVGMATVTAGAFSFEVEDLTVGTHTISAQATDAAGNASAVDTTTVVVKPKAPGTIITGDTPGVAGDGETVDADDDSTATVQVFTAPIIALGNQDVLGDNSTSNQRNSISDTTDTDVMGAADEKDGTFSPLGFAWYWWLVALAAIAGLWWLLAALRRRKDEE